MTAGPVDLHWTARDEPLLPAAVVGEGSVVAALAADTARRLDAGMALTVSHVHGWLLVLGAGDELPWADGVVYLGWDQGLLVPTVSQPDPGPAFLAVALPPAPLRAVLPGRLLSAPLPARPPDPIQLAELR